MRCEEIQGRLSPYLEDELDTGGRREVEDHLRQCGRCRHELALLRRTVAALHSLEEVEVPPRLAAGVEARLAPRKRFDVGRLASWLFVPIHVKLPVQAVALLLVSLGAVYLLRSTPELARAPAPPSVTIENAARDRAESRAAAKRSDLDEYAPAREVAPEAGGRKMEERLEQGGLPGAAEEPGSRAQVQAEGETARALEEKKSARDRAARLPQEGLAAPTAVPPPLELVLRTADPARAAARIADMTTTIGGSLAPTADPLWPTLTVPAEAYPKLLEALRELGELTPPAAKPPQSPQGFVTISLRLLPR